MTRRPIRIRGLRAHSRGVVLFIALIVIFAMMLAGAGLMRSVDTGTVIAGNFAFKQATLQAVDAGIEEAFNATLARVSAAATGSTVTNQYYATLQPVGTNGAPSGILWSTAPVLDLSGTNGNQVQYVVERMCAPLTSGGAPSTVADVAEFCVTEPGDSPPCVRSPCPPFVAESKVNYRVTLRVVGPRNTVTMAQTVLAF